MMSEIQRIRGMVPAMIGLATGLAILLPHEARAEQYGPDPDRKVDATKVTYFVSTDGNDASDGRTRKTAFATLQKAADTVKPGETVLVTKGVYRQGMHIRGEGRPDAWITFVAEPGAVIEGADVRKDWQRDPGDLPVYSISRPNLFGAYQKPETPLQARTEQVFVNGKLLRQAPDRRMLKPKGVFWVDDKAEKLYVCLEGGKNPNEERTEVSVRTYAIAVGGPPNMNFWREERVGLENKAAYIRLDGFTVRHIANFTRMGAIQVRGLCHHILIENCDVQWANYCGIALSSLTIWSPQEKKWLQHLAHDITVRHCIASNNGAQGIGGGGVSDLLIENNLIDNNNYKGISVWNEGGAVKLGFGGRNITVRGNVARDNDNHGLWFDYGSTGCVIENNFVYNSIAGGVLDEVTPAPDRLFRDDGQEHFADPTAAELHARKQQGTVIRNNVIVGTRNPGGGGINISTSNDAQVYNNVIYGCDGHGISFGGSADRPGTQGLKGNTAYSNILDQNFIHAAANRDSDDKRGRFFDNVFRSNLFCRTRSDKPFRISGLPAGPEEWKALNNADNFYHAGTLFKDPGHFDFTLTDEAAARRAGFDPKALRLDWSAFYIPKEIRARKAEARDYFPLDLSASYNRGLADETAGDGKGGWTDQGRNDLSLMPVGRQTLDGIEFLLGSREKGAILLGNPWVKPGGFPDSVSLPVGRTFDELCFLYTSAWTSDTEKVNGVNVRIPHAEIARFIIHYQDGSSSEAPVRFGQHVLDWWSDPTWQEQASLNDHGAYVAWQGPNRDVGKVTVYALRWANPQPAKPIAAVEVTNRTARPKSAFFLLAMTGANRKASGPRERVFTLGFDGDVDALGADGAEIEAQGINRMAFDAGTFVEGVRGKAFVPKTPIFYTVPADFPLQGQGTISLWLKAEDWRTPERAKMYRGADYTRVMTPLSVQGNPSRYSPWGISFEVAKENFDTLAMTVQICGDMWRFDATPLVKPGEWFHLAATWAPRPDGKRGTREAVYFNGKPLGTRDRGDTPDVVGQEMYVGVPKNGGQPWRGAMDELTLRNRCLSPEEVAAAALEALRRRGVTVPEEMALAGFGDVRLAPLLGLITVYQPSTEIGHCAAERLFARLKDPDSPIEGIVLPSGVRWRRRRGIAPTPA